MKVTFQAKRDVRGTPIFHNIIIPNADRKKVASELVPYMNVLEPGMEITIKCE